MLPISGTPVLTAAAMRAAEAAHGDLAALMERAGGGIAAAVHRLAAGAEVLILCGPGNNGGDGYVAARLLAEAGLPVRVAASAEPRTDLARAARVRWTGPVEPLAEARPAPVLVDALFGTGLTRPVAEADTLVRLAGAARLAIAVDLPSGVETDSGACLSPVPPFAVTLALGALKPAHLLHPAAGFCGAVRWIDLGLCLDADTHVMRRPRLARPKAEAHKYSRGMVAIVAGAMPGAAALAVTAAGRAGAGYVLLLGSATDRLPHAVVRRRWADGALDDARIGAVLVGPGLGRDETARGKLSAVLAAPHPLVVDGDALHLLDPAALAGRTAPAILTPHDGEFAALFGDLSGSRIDRARAAAASARAIVVLKGAATVIAGPDGRVVVSETGSPWLSTAGTGDVLAGTIAARLAGPTDAFAAACAGVWLHGEAARRAGPAFLADDLAAHLPQAIAQCL
ncbi:bifunctional NAD(P)H-hydrate repair enzyme [Sphingomonas metalli]|uniref:Bifunctional NAD(P)H-hydrate repair enzyme n=1 Tax=Sphingomonas metalli TaxID=1779358 RepID=A0A916T859_9SPHN|nr:NAD(P)H-hydrate dehydratase [Sphingomonas metalli]GGB33571.1 bifunctional NAD(P)H-hydrate repair enzyme [Sphingomonas metalli]